MATPAGTTPKAILFIDPSTGRPIWPGRVQRELIDPLLKGGGIDTSIWQFVNSGGGAPSIAQASTLSGIGQVAMACGAASNAAAVIRPASASLPFGITPSAIKAMILTVESISMDADTGFEIQFGFTGSNSTQGGAYICHVNGATTAVVRTYSASSVITDYATDFQFSYGNGGTRKQKSLTFALLPGGYDGQTGASDTPIATAFILQDDQEIASVVMPAFDRTKNVYPQFGFITRDSTAHTMKWGQTKLAIIHN
jgi:hypothetical protein